MDNYCKSILDGLNGVAYEDDDQVVELHIWKYRVAERGYENREARIGIREGVDKAIKQYIYSKKDSIIERVVDRASVEIVKKGLPKLLDRLGGVKE